MHDTNTITSISVSESIPHTFPGDHLAPPTDRRQPILVRGARPARVPRQPGRRRRDSRGADQREPPEHPRRCGQLPLGAHHRKERTAPHLPGDGLAGCLSPVRPLRGPTSSAVRIGGRSPGRRHNRGIRTGVRLSADERERCPHGLATCGISGWHRSPSVCWCEPAGEPWIVRATATRGEPSSSGRVAWPGAPTETSTP